MFGFSLWFVFLGDCCGSNLAQGSMPFLIIEKLYVRNFYNMYATGDIL